jgi:hypothetical protein
LTREASVYLAGGFEKFCVAVKLSQGRTVQTLISGNIQAFSSSSFSSSKLSV